MKIEGNVTKTSDVIPLKPHNIKNVYAIMLKEFFTTLYDNPFVVIIGVRFSLTLMFFKHGNS